MSDYIKRSYAKNAICSSCANPCSLVEKANSPCVTIIELFRIPSADVAPVRHGRWIECTSSPHWKCSMCGTKAPIWFDEFNEICEWLSVYCPNCGAKMEGEDDEL